MKILFIHHSGLIGGAGVSLINTIEALKAQGNEIVLTLPLEPDDMQKLAQEHGILPMLTERRIGAITYVSGIDKLLSPRFCYRLWQIIRQWKKWNQRIREINPDVVIVNSKILCWMSSLPAVKERKSICFVRETMAGKPSRWVNRWISKKLDRFAAVAFLSEYDEKKEGLQKARTQVIHNYVQQYEVVEQSILQESQRKWCLTEGRFKILYVGGVSEMKGFHIAVQAVMEMGSDVELMVAGSTFEDVYRGGNRAAIAYAKKMEQYIQEKDAHCQIHMIGKQQDMSVCYELCDVLLFPMQSPHQARPAFEAGYFGKPVVISDFENIVEFVRDGYNGIVAKADDVYAFVRALTDLKDNPDLYGRMGKNNRKNTREHHSMDVIQRQIRKLISEL